MQVTTRPKHGQVNTHRKTCFDKKCLKLKSTGIFLGITKFIRSNTKLIFFKTTALTTYLPRVFKRDVLQLKCFIIIN